MLNLVGISKTFGSVQALKDVSISVGVGEVVGLVGENGAGKSTLMKVLNGIHQPDTGRIEVDGRVVSIHGPRQAASLGIGMVFQEQSLVPNISVAENIFLGHEAPFARGGRIHWPSLHKAARAQLDKVGLPIDPHAITDTLSFMQRQMVELAKVLTLEEATLGNLCILLDEPTSVLERAEIDTLFDVVRKLKSRAGIIFISHRLDEVIDISDRIVVMKDGAVAERLEKAEATPARIHRLMVGREASASYYRQSDRRPVGTGTVLTVKGVSKGRELSDISFDLREGEVLALVGTEGSGAEPLIRAIFGLERITAGSILCGGTQIANTSPGRAVASGIGYVPRERKIEGIVEAMSVIENICLPVRHRMTRMGLLNFPRMTHATKALIGKLRIRTPSGASSCANLSGGNQQKVVLARWYESGARLFLLDHPTRGLDVGAKEDVYALIREIGGGGAAVVLIADTLEEALGLAHSVIVLKDGRETARFDNTGTEPIEPLDLIRHMV